MRDVTLSNERGKYGIPTYLATSLSRFLFFFFSFLAWRCTRPLFPPSHASRLLSPLSSLPTGMGKGGGGSEYLVRMHVRHVSRRASLTCQVGELRPVAALEWRAVREKQVETFLRKSECAGVERAAVSGREQGLGGACSDGRKEEWGRWGPGACARARRGAGIGSAR